MRGPVTAAQSVFLPRSGLSTTRTPGTPRSLGEAFRAGGERAALSLGGEIRGPWLRAEEEG